MSNSPAFTAPAGFAPDLPVGLTFAGTAGSGQSLIALASASITPPPLG
ncbi:hypothetical protein AB0M36_35410 [Actinoplanes sp. NPDC051346]